MNGQGIILVSVHKINELIISMVKLTNNQYFERMILMSFEFEVVSNVG